MKRFGPNVTVLYIYNSARLIEIRLSCLVCTTTVKCRRIEALREDTVKLGGGGVIVLGAVSKRYVGLLHMIRG